MKVKQEQEKITALYERLSRDDEQVGEHTPNSMATPILFTTQTTAIRAVLLSAPIGSV